MKVRTTTAFIAGFLTCGGLVALALSWDADDDPNTSEVK